MLKIALPQSRRKDQTPNPATPFEQFNSTNRSTLAIAVQTFKALLSAALRF
jgi:hypothetical protein